jgi:hypothetical protein
MINENGLFYILSKSNKKLASYKCNIEFINYLN